MKRKQTVVATIVAIIIVISIAVWFVSDSNMLKDMDASDISEITIHNPYEYYTITEPNDIQTLFNVLQSMKLRITLPTQKDGFAFLIDIKYNNGKTTAITILSNDIYIDGHDYHPDKDYCSIIRKIFDTLSKKYKINPA